RDQLLLVGVDERIAFEGPLVSLDPEVSLQLALVLHELATNARKYGALSSPNGRLAITWRADLDDGQTLRLDWKESGGPQVAAPSSRGFGSHLIEKGLAAHGGKALLSFAETGVTCAITMPLQSETRFEAFDGAVTEARRPEGNAEPGIE